MESGPLQAVWDQIACLLTKCRNIELRPEETGTSSGKYVALRSAFKWNVSERPTCGLGWQVDTCELGLQEREDRRPTWHQGPPSFESKPLLSAISLRVRTPPDFSHSNSFFTESDCVAGLNFMGVVFSKNTCYWRRRGSMKSQGCKKPIFNGQKSNVSVCQVSPSQAGCIGAVGLQLCLAGSTCVPATWQRQSSERSREVWWRIRGEGPLLPGAVTPAQHSWSERGAAGI